MRRLSDERLKRSYFKVLFTILLDKVVSFKHSTQILAREVLPVKAINMHVFLCYLESISIRGMFSYKYSTRETANLV